MGDEQGKVVNTTANDLGGEALSAAQARTVHGGIHMYHPQLSESPAARGPTRWPCKGCVVLIVVAGITASILIRRPAGETAGSASLGGPATSVSTAAVGGRSSRPDLIPVDVAIPQRLGGAREERRLAIPEPTNLVALQLYRCAGQQYARAYWASLIVAKQFSGAAEVIDEYANRLMDLLWSSDVVIRYGEPVYISRRTARHEIRNGIQLAARWWWKAGGPCGSGLGVMKAIALDYGDSYLLVIVLAEVDGAGADSPARAERDVDTLVSSARPAR